MRSPTLSLLLSLSQLPCSKKTKAISTYFHFTVHLFYGPTMYVTSLHYLPSSFVASMLKQYKHTQTYQAKLQLPVCAIL